ASSSCAVKLTTSDMAGAMGIVVGGSGTTGNAVIAYGGYASCSFDGATTASDYVQISSTNAADCHDVGASYPKVGQVLGRVLSTNASAGTYGVFLGPDVDGAAPLASPAFTGTPTAPTPTTSDNSTNIATTAFVKAQGYATGGSLVSGNYPKATGSAALGDSGVTAGPYTVPWITVYRGGG